jgi:uncharacterized protein
LKVARLSGHISECIRRSLDGTFIATFCLACIVLLFLGPVSGAEGREVPDYHGYVNDYASMMSPEARTKLEGVLHSFDLSDSTQVAVLTIDSLDGDPLEDFSIRVVDQWKIGQKGKDNGVLFLVVKNDRKMRIEVGRGLEHVLTDLAAGRIIDRVVAPLFKDGRFDEGFEAGITAVIQTTRGEYTPGSRTRGEPPRLLKYLVIGAFLIIFLAANSRKLGAGGGAVLLPFIFFMGLPAPVNWILLLLLLPIGAFVGLVLSSLFSSMAKHGSTGSRGGYYSSGRLGRFGGGGFSSGGFGGFGGGGFGGGGASGGW